MVIFDYFDTDAFIPKKSSPKIQKKQEIFQKLGEKMIMGFNPSTLAEEIEKLRLSLYENLFQQTSRYVISNDSQMAIMRLSIDILHMQL